MFHLASVGAFVGNAAHAEYETTQTTTRAYCDRIADSDRPEGEPVASLVAIIGQIVGVRGHSIVDRVDPDRADDEPDDEEKVQDRQQQRLLALLPVRVSFDATS